MGNTQAGNPIGFILAILVIFLYAFGTRYYHYKRIRIYMEGSKASDYTIHRLSIREAIYYVEYIKEGKRYSKTVKFTWLSGEIWLD